MKGSATSIFIMILAATIIFTTIYAFGITNESGEGIQRGQTIQKDYHTISTALDVASVYLETGLRYSIYQALYEVGLQNKTWYNNGKIDVKQDFLKRLKPSTDAVLIKYTRDPFMFLDNNYLVTLPQYSVEVNVENNTLTADASSSGRLQVEKTRPEENIFLEKTVKMSESFDYKLLSDAQKFLDGVNDADIINQTVSDYFNKTWKTSGELQLSGCQNKGQIESISVFNDANGKGFSNFTQAEQSISAEVASTVSMINLTKYPTVKLSPSTTVLVNFDCPATKNDLCDKPEPSYKYTKTCNFTYSYQINTSVVLENNQTYPVKTDSTIQFVNHLLEFTHIISSQYKA
ncbi:MAG: hypothetical protein HY512_03070 [Candidatus Aenigmarchaeota archaeon]|nr:hypothetical protein [Candidatus Aenigmarchaeota archaeon]